jgi:hypothetical protein
MSRTTRPGRTSPIIAIASLTRWPETIPIVWRDIAIRGIAPPTRRRWRRKAKGATFAILSLTISLGLLPIRCIGVRLRSAGAVSWAVRVATARIIVSVWVTFAMVAARRVTTATGGFAVFFLAFFETADYFVKGLDTEIVWFENTKFFELF